MSHIEVEQADRKVRLPHGQRRNGLSLSAFSMRRTPCPGHHCVCGAGPPPLSVPRPKKPPCVGRAVPGVLPSLFKSRVRSMLNTCVNPAVEPALRGPSTADGRSIPTRGGGLLAVDQPLRIPPVTPSARQAAAASFSTGQDALRSGAKHDTVNAPIERAVRPAVNTAGVRIFPWISVCGPPSKDGILHICSKSGIPAAEAAVFCACSKGCVPGHIAQ